MSDARAVAKQKGLALCDVREFRKSPESRVLLEALIYFLDLRVKDPEQWPALETILTAALEARERAVWEEAEKYIETVINQRVDPVLLDAAKTKREVSATREEREEYDMLLEIRDECRRHGGLL